MTKGDDVALTTNKRTYSLVDISEKIGRPRTTLADWIRQFREYIPTVGQGRTMRYTEEALEVFGLISKMKDANEPTEYIREQLKGVVRQITVPMTEDDGKPYLMHLAGEVDELKRAVVMLAQQLEALKTENDGARREAAATFEQVVQRVDDVSGSLAEIQKGQDEIRQGQEQILSRVETLGKRKKFLGLF